VVNGGPLANDLALLHLPLICWRAEVYLEAEFETGKEIP